LYCDARSATQQPTVFENTHRPVNDMGRSRARQHDQPLPDLTQNQGAEFTIVVARDLDFSSVYALQAGGCPMNTPALTASWAEQTLLARLPDDASVRELMPPVPHRCSTMEMSLSS